jgi:hypothetical protein
MRRPLRLDSSSLSFFLTSRDAFLIRRVKTYTTKKSTGAIDSEIRVKRQFKYRITPMMPTSVRTLVTMPRRAEVTKSKEVKATVEKAVKEAVRERVQEMLNESAEQ